MIQVRRVDENGFIIEDFVFVLEKELTDDLIVKEILDGYVKPKFNREINDWEEGATQEEIDEWHEANKPQPQEPTLEDKFNLLEEKNQALQEKIATLEEELMSTNQYMADLELRALL